MNTNIADSHIQERKIIMNEQITITISIEQYNAIKSALLNNQAKAFMDEDQTAYEMYQSAYLAVISAETERGDS